MCYMLLSAFIQTQFHTYPHMPIILSSHSEISLQKLSKREHVQNICVWFADSAPHSLQHAPVWMGSALERMVGVLKYPLTTFRRNSLHTFASVTLWASEEIFTPVSSLISHFCLKWRALSCFVLDKTLYRLDVCLFVRPGVWIFIRYCSVGEFFRLFQFGCLSKKLLTWRYLKKK